MQPYPHHERRTVMDLNELWDFVFLGAIDPRSVKPPQVRCDDHLPVPLAFDATPRYAGRRGTAVYKKTLTIPAHQAARLRFGAVGMWCAVFVDGKKLAEHGDGYTEFWVDVPAARSTTRELAVVVDNQFSNERNPLQMEYYDWYHYGGVYRPVYLHLLPAVFLERVQVRVIDVKKGMIALRVHWGASSGDFPAEESLQIAIDGKIVHTAAVALKKGVSDLHLTVPKPTPWSPEKPALHRLQVTTPTDDLIVRFGLREVKVHGRELRLNGRALKLKGFCRHEAHPQFGPALPVAMMVEDIHQLKDLGCNFIRGSHYPQDQRFLDLCDELGMLVWEEGTGWGNKDEHFSNPAFCAAQERGVTEMITASYNHPCVILWGFLNEGDSRSKIGKKLYQRLADVCHRLDTTRPVSFADMHTASICLPLADVISYNLYPAWYGENAIAEIPGILRERVAIARKATGDKRPFIVSEIGAGAIYGWRDSHATRWSEQYQSELLDTVCQEVLSNADILGISIWQFGDIRTSQKASVTLGRPRAFNNKGVVDEWRRPKQAYFTVKARFRGPVK